MSKESQDDPDLRFHWQNARIVSAACDRYFARKGLKCHDVQGNQINPMTKEIIEPYTPKKSKRS